ncbi:MAG TPA: hypothetical protein VMV09_02330 [Candidatus Saccharimonadales bacterium]|nr:hypothetical protein [Candidatus Saccharimonadales bacterium]
MASAVESPLLRRLSSSERADALGLDTDYPVFIGIAEKIGQDKRGNTIYRHNDTGEGVVVIRRESVSEVDPTTGLEVSATGEVKERLVVDDLDEIANAHLTWLMSQS